MRRESRTADSRGWDSPGPKRRIRTTINLVVQPRTDRFAATTGTSFADAFGMIDPQTTRFWQGALKSGLIDAAGLRKCWEQIPEGKRTADAADRRLARQTIDLGRLTVWQAQQILNGRTVGFQVDRYLLLNLIGQGGMGRVYLAKDTRLNRHVALKVLSPERMNNPRAIARFQREARVGAQLQHENLVRIYDEGEANGRCYLVMEYIEGSTIGRRINEQGPVPYGEACRYARQTALGLEHARQKGLIHRDVNPWNILVTPVGVAKLTDLGLAIDLGVEADAVTRDGATVGTFDYISPEQARHSHSVDTRSDIYSLGCTLYHMIAGQVPFPSPSLPEKLYAHQLSEPAPMGSIVKGVPDRLEGVVARMMRKDPGDRFPTPLDVALALEPFIDRDERDRSPRLSEIDTAERAIAGTALTTAQANGAFDFATLDLTERARIAAQPTTERADAVADEPASPSGSGLKDLKPAPKSPRPPDESDFVWPTELPIAPRAGAAPGIAQLFKVDSDEKSTEVRQRPASKTPKSSASDASSPKAPAVAPTAPEKPPARDSQAPPIRNPFDPSHKERNRRYATLAAASVIVCLGAFLLLSALQNWRSVDKPVSSEAELNRLKNDSAAPTRPRPPLAVVYSDGDEQEVKDLAEGFQITGRGAVQIRLGPKGDQKVTVKEALVVPKETLAIRGGDGASSKIFVALETGEPFIRVQPEGRLILENLTIEAEYSAKNAKTPPLLEVAGEALIRNCSIRLLSSKAGAIMIHGEGRRVDLENSWILGFGHVLDLDLFGGSRASVKRSLVTGDRAFSEAEGRLFRIRLANSLAPGKTRTLEVTDSTLVGPGVFGFDGFTAEDPIKLSLTKTIVYAKSLLDWKSKEGLTSRSLEPHASSNIYAIEPGPFAQADPPPAPAKVEKWLEFASERGSYAETPAGYADAAAKPPESVQPADFPSVAKGSTAIGADPPSIGPQSGGAKADAR